MSETQAPSYPVVAYAHCDSVTRRRAANFYWGIRLLPRERRHAMCAVYAFARRVDDIGDGRLDAVEKLARLDRQERALAGLASVSAPAACLPSSPSQADPVMVALSDACARFRLPREAFGELIEGVRMDVTGAVYERFEDLVPYCRCVAGAIGRLCLGIFDSHRPSPADGRDAERLADDLGIAMQLTNILRDLREDAEAGRVYVPAEDLRRFGVVSAGEGRATPPLLASLARGPLRDRDAAAQNARGAAAERGERTAGLCELMRFEASRAQRWFGRGMELAPLLDRRSAACVLSMANIYRRLLDRIEAEPERALRERVSLQAPEKAWIAARSVLGASGRQAPPRRGGLAGMGGLRERCR
jgi:phytoene synthase